MNWLSIISYITFLLCIAIMGYHLAKLIRLGKPVDYANPSGEVKKGVVYSSTGAMMPGIKESAYLNLPVYTAGLAFHLGTFLAILIYVLLPFFLPEEGSIFRVIIAIPLFAGALSGIAVLIKRIFVFELRALSNPDDFISNILVSLFQITLAIYMLHSQFAPAFWISAIALWVYFPIGKLKHALYFFAARYHLGFFFGRRGVWPPPKSTDI